MEQTKRPRGRPGGQRYPFSRQIRLSQNQEELLRRLSERWDCQQVDVIRRLIVEAAEREGLTTATVRPPAPDWQERFRALLAKAQSSATGDLTPEELEREVTLARAEVREQSIGAGDASR